MSWRALLLALGGTLAASVWLASICPAQGAQAAPFRASCPQSLAPPALTPPRALVDWTVAMPLPARLSGGGLLWGPPDESGYLKPDEATTNGPAQRRVGVTRWRLTVPHAYETWLYCSYGSLLLARRIPPDATECSATSASSRDTFDALTFTCR